MNEMARTSHADDKAADRDSATRPKRRSQQADEVPAWAQLDGTPTALRRLGPGTPLDGAVSARMGTALGGDFSHVRVHEGPEAAGVSSSLGARAFSYGHHVGFGAGEYRPGTLMGDAIIAHELAHVQQQQSVAAGPADVAVRDGDAASAEIGGNEMAFEHDADRAAVGAVGRLWGIASQVSNGLLQAGGRLQATRPRIRRCDGHTSGTRIPDQIPQTAPATQATPAASCVTRTPAEWQTAIDAANKLSGDDKATALTTVAGEALCAVGLTANKAGTKHPDQTHSDDYVEAPVINFDVQLNAKKKWQTDPKVPPNPVGSNAGYQFSDGAKKYVVIGPNALLSPPFSIRQYAQHELAHTTQPKGLKGPEAELPVWTEDFRNYFHQYFALSSRPTWTPLIQYYEDAKPETRAATIKRLVDYFNNPPLKPAEVEDFRKQFRMWMTKSSGTLIDDLNKALPPAPKP